MNEFICNIGTAIDYKKVRNMLNMFGDNVGTEIFARNLFLLNNEIPSDRYVDSEYSEITRRTLLNEEEN